MPSGTDAVTTIFVGLTAAGASGNKTSQTMAAAAAPILVKLWSSSSSPLHRKIPGNGFVGPSTSTVRPSRYSPTSSSMLKTKKGLLARASRPEAEQAEEEEDDNNNIKAFNSPEDFSYLWKLGAGSVGGAAVIKYGSVLFPDITRPNILLALIMITAPMVVVALILVKQSRFDEELNKGPS